MYDLNRVGDYSRQEAGHNPDEEGLARVQRRDTAKLQDLPLQVLIGRELDCRVADQHQGGNGATPQAKNPFVTGLLDQTVWKCVEFIDVYLLKCWNLSGRATYHKVFINVPEVSLT